MASFAVVIPTLVKIDDLTVDCSVSETHTFENELTENPVERGAAVVDHRRSKPNGVTIVGIVSNTPIKQEDREADGANQRAEAAFTRLLELREAGELFTVKTKRRTYNNMAIVSLVVPADASIGDALQFSVTFREIRVVDSKTVKLKTSTNKGKKKQEKGKETGKEVTDQQQKKTWLEGGIEAAESLFSQ
jgi:hypothetical protein